MVVWGEVGCGKTHLTRQYFYTHRADYPSGSFWVDCRSTETIVKGLWDIGMSIGALNDIEKRADTLGTDDFADAVRVRLESMEGWLLVFDGVSLDTDQAFDSFRRYLPDRKGNCIIYTSVDRGLVHRVRLLYPSGLKVGKLSVGDATDLLFKHLGVRHAINNAQQQKALELVKDNDFLPLAIYATAHALIERGRTLERYSHTTTDQRLVRPFLDIVTGLHDQGRVEAVNLINLLCFFTHHVPVALINFGYRGLLVEPFAIDVQSPRYTPSTRKDLETSISILLRSGLLERTLQTWTRSSVASSQEEDKSSGGHPDVISLSDGSAGVQKLEQNFSVDGEASSGTKAKRNGYLDGQPSTSAKRSMMIRTLENTPPVDIPEDSSGLDDMMLERFESRGTRTSRTSAQCVVDTLRVHTVVQNIIRDDLRGRPLVGERDYWWWLCAAARLLLSSYATASEKLRGLSGPGLIRDYREYEAQAARLFQHFPKTSLKATAELRRARHDIRSLLRTVKQEINSQSLSSSPSKSWGGLQEGSIFERASSSTSLETQSFLTLSPASSWSMDPGRPPSESPTSMFKSADELPKSPIWGPGVLHSDETGVADEVLSDSASWIISDTTEMPNNRSRRSSVLHAVLEGKPRIRQQKDLGEFHEYKAPSSTAEPQSARCGVRTRSPQYISRCSTFVELGGRIFTGFGASCQSSYPTWRRSCPLY